jgi:hypothetical protein
VYPPRFPFLTFVSLRYCNSSLWATFGGGKVLLVIIGSQEACIVPDRHAAFNRQGVTVRAAVFATPLVAEIFTLVWAVTVFVVTVKVAVVFPEVTVTLAGTVATAVELLERVTTVPAEGAGPVIVTVPVEGTPPLTEVGLNVSELTTGV